MNLIQGDCIEVMAGMEAESIDAVCTDPPYGLEFMGKAWDKLDGGLPQEKVWKGRRGKGGSNIGTDDSGPASRHHISFGGGQQGFKRCATCGKRAFSGSPCQCQEPSWVIEYAQSAPSSAIRMGRWHEAWAREAYRVAKPSSYLLAFGGTRTVHRMTCAIEDAGWIVRDMLVWAYASGFPKSRASLKPAWEPIVMARKPGPLRMLNIDECRIPLPAGDAEFIASRVGSYRDRPGPAAINVHRTGEASADHRYPEGTFAAAPGSRGGSPAGRWPANVILTDPIFDGGVEGVVGGGETSSGSRSGVYGGGGYSGDWPDVSRDIDGDSGTYSRFFLIPKADRSDREPVLGGLPEATLVQTVALGDMAYATLPDGRKREAQTKARANHHPTVKPLDLMRHLVRLVTPSGGVVLDPFLGSGTTALACEMEGFEWVGIEREPEYVAFAEARLNGTQRGLGLTGEEPA